MTTWSMHGVTHKFGYSPEKKAIPDRYKGGPISSIYVMNDEITALKEENARIKQENEDTKAKLAMVMENQVYNLRYIL